jgi:hypothetical protein
MPNVGGLLHIWFRWNSRYWWWVPNSMTMHVKTCDISLEPFISFMFSFQPSKTHNMLNARSLIQGIGVGHSICWQAKGFSYYRWICYIGGCKWVNRSHWHPFRWLFLNIYFWNIFELKNIFSNFFVFIC